jgi:hypothetical protein
MAKKRTKKYTPKTGPTIQERRQQVVESIQQLNTAIATAVSQRDKLYGALEMLNLLDNDKTTNKGQGGDEHPVDESDVSPEVPVGE